MPTFGNTPYKALKNINNSKFCILNSAFTFRISTFGSHFLDSLRHVHTYVPLRHIIAAYGRNAELFPYCLLPSYGTLFPRRRKSKHPSRRNALSVFSSGLPAGAPLLKSIIPLATRVYFQSFTKAFSYDSSRNREIDLCAWFYILPGRWFLIYHNANRLSTLLSRDKAHL